MPEAFDIPGFVPAFIRPLFCRGAGPFRWAALSGDPADIATTDQAVLETFPRNEALARWIHQAQERVQFQGVPARICWLEYGERAEMGLRFNWLVKHGKVRAPIVIGRDHLDTGSVASPNRETEGMKDGSDAIADWPLLNACSKPREGAGSLHTGLLASGTDPLLLWRWRWHNDARSPGEGLRPRSRTGSAARGRGVRSGVEKERERGVICDAGTGEGGCLFTARAQGDRANGESAEVTTTQALLS